MPFSSWNKMRRLTVWWNLSSMNKVLTLIKLRPTIHQAGWFNMWSFKTLTRAVSEEIDSCPNCYIKGLTDGRKVITKAHLKY